MPTQQKTAEWKEVYFDARNIARPQMENEWGAWCEMNEMSDMKIQTWVKNQKISTEVQQTKESKNEWRGKYWV